MTKMTNLSQERLALAGSFRDPCGFVYRQDSQIFRQVNQCYRTDYDKLIESGLYNRLSESNLLIGHEEIAFDSENNSQAYKILRPVNVPFVSWPGQWCFTQLKDAALTTLTILRESFDCGMTLKDSTAYNIQFLGSKATFIDTLSFTAYQTGQPWQGYQQFCRHFLTPLALMSMCDIRLGHLQNSYIDGIPLDLAAKLLPFKARLNLSLLMHIILHARSQQRYADNAQSKTKAPLRKISKTAWLGLIDSLKTSVEKLKWQLADTEWGDYYQQTNYNQTAMKRKMELAEKYLREISPKITWDIGANEGVFSEIAAQAGSYTVAFDIDPVAVEKHYLKCRNENNTRILPLILDLTNPCGALGWENRERASFIEQGPADAVMALALIHHLAISNNLPFAKIVDFLAEVSRHLIIEFVPKEDSQVQRLLASREDIFGNYDQPSFEDAFGQSFEIIHRQPIDESKRTLYLMRSKKHG